MDQYYINVNGFCQFVFITTELMMKNYNMFNTQNFLWLSSFWFCLVEFPEKIFSLNCYWYTGSFFISPGDTNPGFRNTLGGSIAKLHFIVKVWLGNIVRLLLTLLIAFWSKNDFNFGKKKYSVALHPGSCCMFLKSMKVIYE